MKAIPMVGRKFGRVTVLRETPSSFRKRNFECLCSCGETFIAAGANLRNGHTQSCGCLQRENTSAANITHGAKAHDAPKEQQEVYNIWCGIRYRCSNINDSNYGGRGIILAPEWDDFAVFYAAIGPRPSSKYSIDRIDNEKGYIPGNVRWATKQEQVNNTRCNVLITYKGKTQTLMQWSKELNLEYKTLHTRLSRNWPIARMFETEIRSFK